MKKQIISTLATGILFLWSSLAWGAPTEIYNLPYTITQAGSYYIGHNLNSTGDGITINANDVTIDFQGNTIYGVVESGTGIKTTLTTLSNIEIRNGSVVEFGNGINFGTAVN